MKELFSKLLYMDQMDLLRYTARIVKIGQGEFHNKRYKWIVLDETIFHPKGGGQPSDEGTIGAVNVAYVHKERGDQTEIFHCFDETQDLPFKEGDKVELIVDGTKRKLFSQMHTAGHLLAHIVQTLFPELTPSHGNHDPENGFVKFKMGKEIPYDKQKMLSQIQAALNLQLQHDIPVLVVPLPDGLRGIQIDQQIMPCGGTHVANVKEIGPCVVSDITLNYKDTTLTVKYRKA